eukprot:CAMPEP_0113321828 /NCGR_PEP_ID=MMETSP0010_2-20120614/15182_1 /TAXON_ID=216773 ORGANISM="Corethron hystrix, Strain 308" /NCGR_SAMPLE_ID=MMETSP0010_2 /ASSEMBLY_ACC=CAM_ASM_000155 /LENGTH=141 /DNA_ID=CAMNT_0000180091 /DNA_START=1 /DNA_END=423 /DNA_ORIENTATION=+ /assembly_acc=CAM_ASM_000155
MWMSLCTPDESKSVTVTATTVARRTKVTDEPSAAIYASYADVATSSGGRKFYIEDLQISFLSFDLSLKGGLSLSGRFMWLAGIFLTGPFSLFLNTLYTSMESHPFVFRPYARKHAYGTMQDHLLSLRSHYINPWGLIGAFL